jgi:hypothetical protein
VNPDARSCAEESATVKMNCWRQKKSSPFRATRNVLFGHDGILKKTVESGSEVCIPVWVSIMGLRIMVLKNKIPGSDIYQQVFFFFKSQIIHLLVVL